MIREGNYVQVLSETKPRAKKQHYCDAYLCNQMIEIGSRYRKSVYIDDDGKFQCEKLHLRHFTGDE